MLSLVFPQPRSEYRWALTLVDELRGAGRRMRDHENEPLPQDYHRPHVNFGPQQLGDSASQRCCSRLVQQLGSQVQPKLAIHRGDSQQESPAEQMRSCQTVQAQSLVLQLQEALVRELQVLSLQELRQVKPEPAPAQAAWPVRV